MDRMPPSPWHGALPLARGGQAMPAVRHVPGSGTVPDGDLLAQVRALTPAVTTDSAWRENIPYRYGWDLFAAGYFWEAHEVWEGVWLAAPPNARERGLLRAIIQLANARLKLVMERPAAAARLQAQVLSLLADCGPAPVMGIDPTNLARDVAAGRV